MSTEDILVNTVIRQTNMLSPFIFDLIMGKIINNLP